MGKIQCSRSTQGHKPNYTASYISIPNYGDDVLVPHKDTPNYTASYISIPNYGDDVLVPHKDTRLGFPFAKLLRNEMQNFSFFARKNNKLRYPSQKSFRAKLPYSAFAKLKFCAIPQFHKNQTVDDGVCFLEFNSGKSLFWNVFLLVTFT